MKDEELVHRIIDEAELKKIENLQRSEEENRKFLENHKRTVFKTKITLLTIWLILVVILFLLSNSTLDTAGFSPYHLLLIPIFIFGTVIIIKEILKFFKNN